MFLFNARGGRNVPGIYENGHQPDGIVFYRNSGQPIAECRNGDADRCGLVVLQFLSCTQSGGAAGCGVPGGGR